MSSNQCCFTSCRTRVRYGSKLIPWVSVSISIDPSAAALAAVFAVSSVLDTVGEFISDGRALICATNGAPNSKSAAMHRLDHRIDKSPESGGGILQQILGPSMHTLRKFESTA